MLRLRLSGCKVDKVVMQGCIGWQIGYWLVNAIVDSRADRMPWLLACDFVGSSMHLPII